MEKDQSSSMDSPLIHISEEGVNLNVKRQVNGNNFRRKEIAEEVKKQLWLAGPLLSVSLLQYCLQMISVMFVGHLGELPLSGASMATSFASVTGFSLLVSWVSVCFLGKTLILARCSNNGFLENGRPCF